MYLIGAILPHTKLFGGVKRFFELGEIFIRRGHKMIILTPDGTAPEWFSFSGTVDKISNIRNYDFTALFLTEPQFLQPLLFAKARVKIFYHVGSAKLRDVLKHKQVKVFVNSTNMYEYDLKHYRIKAVKAVGGVHLPQQVKDLSQPDQIFTVMCYGRLNRKRKGTRIVVKAVEKLHKNGYIVKLLLFDTPIDEKGKKLAEQFKCKAPFEFVLNHPVEKNIELFRRASVFVSAERKGGWANNAAEALATGVPLVATQTGTKDFLIHNETGLKVIRHSFFIQKALEKLYNDVELRKRLAENGRKKIEAFSWDALTDRLLYLINQYLREQETERK
ncbi:MAG: glycosyltransferase family 4 protein [Chitinophagaceae bacterium]|nr:glycosyltransferase family 4 protein [Chitinophagaceae bacterium]